jgi:hypothetical protein
LPFIYIEKLSHLEAEKLEGALNDAQRATDSNTVAYVLGKLGGGTLRRKSTEGAAVLISLAQEQLHNSKSEVSKIYELVTSSTDGTINWAIIEFNLNPESVSTTESEHLKVKASGTGGLSELRPFVDDDGLAFIFLRFAFGERRKKVKTLLITWVGPNAAEPLTRLALLDLRISKAFSFHKEIRISNRSKLSDEYILQTLRQFTHTDEIMLRVSLVEKSGKTGNPVIVYVDQEHSVYDIKQVIEDKLHIPKEKQRLWKTRSLNLIKKARQEIEKAPLTFGRHESAITEIVDDDEKNVLNDLELDNADRIFVE